MDTLLPASFEFARDGEIRDLARTAVNHAVLKLGIDEQTAIEFVSTTINYTLAAAHRQLVDAGIAEKPDDYPEWPTPEGGAS